MTKKFAFIVTILLFVFSIGSAQDSKNQKVDPALSLFQYGALGAIVIAGGWYILYLHKRHDKQIEIRDSIIKDQFQKMNESSKETATILTELKTLIQQDILIKRTH